MSAARGLRERVARKAAFAAPRSLAAGFIAVVVLAACSNAGGGTVVSPDLPQLGDVWLRYARGTAFAASCGLNRSDSAFLMIPAGPGPALFTRVRIGPPEKPRPEDRWALERGPLLLRVRVVRSLEIPASLLAGPSSEVLRRADPADRLMIGALLKGTFYSYSQQDMRDSSLLDPWEKGAASAADAANPCDTAVRGETP